MYCVYTFLAKVMSSISFSRSIHLPSFGALLIFILSLRLALYRNEEEHASPQRMHNKNNFSVFYDNHDSFLSPLPHRLSISLMTLKESQLGDSMVKTGSVQTFILLSQIMSQDTASTQKAVMMSIHPDPVICICHPSV